MDAPRLLYPTKLSITIDRQNKIFLERTRFNQFLATNLALYKVLEQNSNARKLATTTKTQTIDDLTTEDPKEGGNTHNIITNNEN